MSQQNPESLDIWGKPLKCKLVPNTYKQERKKKEGKEGGREEERNLEENKENHKE